MAKLAEFYITEGGHTVIIGNNILPALGVEVRRKSVAGFVLDVGTNSTLTSLGGYSPIQRNCIKITLIGFKEIFKCKGALKNGEVRTQFHEPLRRIQVKRKKILIKVLPKVEETIRGWFRTGTL